ncbi:CHASE2 domain-containing protein [Calothrix sp. NIES-3974]|uniref:CHASE2 domain-containing protein n=1 Tax=Calothrix sp. NIES-3974 TaxID=2005462 RepID=UPI000B6136D6|nr:CHASE2 domain-containing protein [Calothrix sp. NIES-3974]BAZ06248.1 hypothetical protein NIES3974_29060 [Calothrix sp. NIES-3974]
MHLNSTILKLRHISAAINREILTTLGVAGCVLVVRALGLLQFLELFLFDQFFLLRPQETSEQRVVIVTIDEGTLRRLGSWPLSDKKIHQSLEKLQKYQPRAIGLHIFRDLPVQPGTDELTATLKTMPNVVGIEKISEQYSDRIPAHPALKPQQVGFNNLLFDADGKVRRNLLYLHDSQNRRYDSFALRVAQLYLRQENILPTSGRNNYLRMGDTLFERFRSHSGSYVNADAKGYQIIANFPKPQCLPAWNEQCGRHGWGFRQVSLLDVLENRVADDWFRDRIVLIGTTASSLQDFTLIPYSSRLMGQAETFAGVELQAFFISELLSATLDQRPLIKVWPDSLEIGWIFLWSYFGSITWWRSQSGRSAFFTAIILCAVACGGAFLIFILDGWWIPIFPAMLAFTATAIATGCQVIYVNNELKRSTDFLHQIINTIADPVYVKDRHHRLIVVNEAYCKLIGYAYNDVINQTDYSLFPKTQAEVLIQHDKLVLEGNQPSEHEEEITNSWDETFLISTKRSLHRDAAGNQYLVGVIRDITERKQYEEDLIRKAEELHRSNRELRQSEDKLRFLAFHDPLTGLPNRKLFMEQLQESIEWSRKNNLLLGLLFIDLDGFKQVNDTLGHEMGDRLLITVAGRMNNVLRSSDTVARLGGDEFTIILRSIPKLEVAAKIADKILTVMSEPIVLDNNIARVSASIGISIYPLSCCGARVETTEEYRDTLIRQADTAMYRAKHYGKNRYEFA